MGAGEFCLVNPMIAAVISSYGRLPLLARLLRSLRAIEPAPPRVIVVDNKGDGAVISLVSSAGLPDVVVLAPGRNLCTGGGLALGMKSALADPAVRYCAQLDDDSVIAPSALAGLQRAMDASDAGAASPMIVREDGGIGWFPGLQEPSKWAVVVRANRYLTPEEYLASCGPAPVPFTWAPWPVMMFKREVIERVGMPRDDIWYQGVDLEYTLRLASHRLNLWVPSERSWHLPPDLQAQPRQRYWRDCINLQNCSYIFARLPHGRRALKHLPGAYWRFFRAWGAGARPLADATRAFCWGVLRASPVGVPGCTRFRDRLLAEL